MTTAPAPVDRTGQPAETAEGVDDAVVVRLGAGRFAVTLEHVAEVGKVPPITRVPGVPAWVAGVVNWRGRVLPIVNLHSVLGADNLAFRPATRLVVLVTDVATVGLLVDAVEGTASLGALGAPVPLLLSGPGADLVRGQVALDDGPVAVLDVDAVLHLREGLPRGRRSA